jgi:hypothetical protein
MSEGEVDKFLVALMKDGHVMTDGREGMMFDGECGSFYVADGGMSYWKAYNGMLYPQVHVEHERRFANQAAAVSRFMLLGAPLDETRVAEVLYENPVFSVVPYLCAALRFAVREFDASVKGDEVKRSLSPLVLGLMDRIAHCKSDSVICNEGVWMVNGHYPALPEKWSGDWGSSQGCSFKDRMMLWIVVMGLSTSQVL